MSTFTIPVPARSQIRDARQLADRLATCACGETLSPRGHCLNVGDCARADRAASRQSHRKGRALSAPAAWTIGGGVD